MVYDYPRSFRRSTQLSSRKPAELAKQAGGAVLVRQGDSVVLVTACRAASPRDVDFLPLTVEYRENAYASGRIPGGFFKREGKPAEKEALTCRLIDRPIRPLFPGSWRYETQIAAMVLSADGENDTDVLAITGASAALSISELPFEKTIAGVRVGLVNGQFVINLTFAQRKESKLDLVVAGSKDGLVMVEAGAKEVTEEQVVGALEAAHEAIKQIVATIEDMAKAVGKKKIEFKEKTIDATLQAEFEKVIMDPLAKAMRIHDKLENYAAVDQVLADVLATIPEDEMERRAAAKATFKSAKEKVLYNEILTTTCASMAASSIRSVRSGSRPASCRARTASSVFTRGETQALVTCTLGTADDAQKIETYEGETWKSFMLHYNFPPFSVGEVGRMSGPGRREIGHGALAERALAGMMPAETD